jgi:pantoate--beta-alanine ligase
MRIARSISGLREAVAAARGQGRRIGFVPTMGYLHDGHLSLVDAARRSGADFVVVSIFVNPLQFGPNEDFQRYPRNEERDRELLSARAVDLLFLPAVEEMYPPGSASVVHVKGVALPLEGERRPGHFDGVATVVLKLFNMVQPDLAVFGAKDAQQCAVVAQMVRDLDVPLQLVFSETVREADGLAMSSRNSYLEPAERVAALALSRALDAGKAALMRGAGIEEAERAMAAELAATASVTLDYLSVVDPATFLPPSDLERVLLLAGAIRVGRTRLIDNLRIAAPTASEVANAVATVATPGSRYS